MCVFRQEATVLYFKILFFDIFLVQFQHMELLLQEKCSAF